MSENALLAVLIVGLSAGWFTGQFVQGSGFGIIGDLITGIVGAFIGNWLLPRLGIDPADGVLANIINATIGAVFLLLAIRLARGAEWRTQRDERWRPPW